MKELSCPQPPHGRHANRAFMLRGRSGEQEPPFQLMAMPRITLISVMRVKDGDAALLFNGRDGEWPRGAPRSAKRGPCARMRLSKPPLEQCQIRPARADQEGPHRSGDEKATELASRASCRC